MVVCEEKYPKILDEILQFLSQKNVELIFTNSEKIREINKKFRGKDKPTDVLSFPLIDVPHSDFLGSIVINLDLVDKASKDLKHSFDDEISLLFIHGLLHLLGFDHEIDNGEMRKKESEIIEKFSLPESLIIRNNG